VLALLGGVLRVADTIPAGIHDPDEGSPLVGVLGQALHRQGAGAPLGVERVLVEVELADDCVQLVDSAAHRLIHLDCMRAPVWRPWTEA
jgi:hypothetical protein